MTTHCIIGAGSATAKPLIESYISQEQHCHLIVRDRSSIQDFVDHPKITIAEADVTDADALREAIHNGSDTFASMTYLPGTIILKDLKQITKDDIDHHMAVNAMGALLSAQFAFDQLKAHGDQASIVFISSVAANKGFMKHALISMCKAALQGLTVALAKELAPHVRVNCIAPSLTHSKMSKGVIGNDQFAQALANAHPLKRLGQPEDLANTISFLHSKAASWITGQVIGVDGGRASLD